MMGGGNVGEHSGIMDASGFSDDLSRSHNTGSNANLGAQGRDGGQASHHRTMYLVELKEPLAHDVLTLSLNNQGPNSKNIEIILYGQGCKNHIVAKMAK